MSKQIVIIGLGQFGMSLAKTLSKNGAEVIAIDARKNLVEEASSFVAKAIIMDATNETELSSIEPSKRDSVVCAIGDESKEATIIVVALLKQMGAPLIIARANNKLHQRILKLIGADEIINPEHEFGQRYANRLLYSDIIVDASMGEDLQLTEISVQPSMIGKDLIELALPKRFGIIVVGIRDKSTNQILQPVPNQPLNEGNNLIIVSSQSAITKFVKEI